MLTGLVLTDAGVYPEDEGFAATGRGCCDDAGFDERDRSLVGAVDAAVDCCGGRGCAEELVADGVAGFDDVCGCDGDALATGWAGRDCGDWVAGGCFATSAWAGSSFFC